MVNGYHCRQINVLQPSFRDALFFVGDQAFEFAFQLAQRLIPHVRRQVHNDHHRSDFLEDRDLDRFWESI